jgi:arylsulfatase A-like enzyme
MTTSLISLNRLLRRHPILLGAFVALIIGLTACFNPPEEHRPPNIVLILTDDQGYQDVGVYGSPDIKTPYLDRLAKQGTRFTRFYASQPVCSASRAALLTGCYPNRVGISGALEPRSRRALAHNEVTIAEMLKPLEYATACYGKWHLGDHPDYLPLAQGFDDFFGIPYSNDMWPKHPRQGTVFNFPPLPLIEDTIRIDTLKDQSQLTTSITERAVHFIKKNREEPFFLYVPHPMPHVPLYVSDKFKGSSKRGLYGDVIAEIDWSVGQIMKALDRHDLEDNTLVIFTSDNGPWLSYGEHGGSAGPLREGKHTTWEGGIRVPCIMRWKNKIPAGRVEDTPLMNIDLLPTLAAITGAELPGNTIDGRNLWPVISGAEGAENPHDAYCVYSGNNELQAVISHRWKLHFPHQYLTLEGRSGGMGGLPADYKTAATELALYNLKIDVAEANNVAADYPGVVTQLKGFAKRCRKDLGDRLAGKKGKGRRHAAEVVWD